MVEMFRTLRQISRRIQAGKSAEVANEMGLVEIAAVRRDACPFDRPPRAHETQHLLKAPDAAEQLGRETDLAAEDLYEALRAQADLPGYLRNRALLGNTLKLVERKRHGGMLLQRAYTKAEFEELISHTEFAGLEIAENLIGLEILLTKGGSALLPPFGSLAAARAVGYAPSYDLESGMATVWPDFRPEQEDAR